MSSESALNGLNDQQKDVVCTTEGPVLVLAGAGTGKTRAVTCRIAHLLTKKGVPAQHILAMTFTNKAANEMKARIVALVGRKGGAGLTVSTFHSLCVRILRENPIPAGLGKNFTIYDERDQMGLIRAALRERQIADKGIDPEVLLGRVSNAKADLVMPHDFKDSNPDKYGEISRQVYEAYQEMLCARNAVDFDDLIMRVILMFRKHPEILREYHDRYRYIMVDEFQDTSRSQFILVDLLAKGERNLCVVGDDDQSIYAWRGAQVSNIRDFKKSFKGAKVIKLEENYRSTGCILQVANTLISRNRGRMEKNLWTRMEEGDKVDVIIARDESDEAETVVRNLILLHERKGLEYRKAAILYRSNLQSRVFEEELRKRRVPYRLVGGQGFYDRKEVRDVAAYLKLMHNPQDEASLLRIINVPRRGIGETTLARAVETAHRQGSSMVDFLRSNQMTEIAGPGIRAEVLSFLSLVERYRRRCAEDPLDSTLQDLLKEMGYEQELRRCAKSEVEGMRRWENVQELVASMARYAAEEAKPSLADYLDRASLVGREDRPEMEGPESGLTLMTIHSAKGLEFPVVFLVGVEEDFLPHARSLSEGRDALSEERRLCYVAITRAQKYLVISRAATRMQYGKPRPRAASRFLSEIPENLTRVRYGLAGPPDEPSPKRRRSRRSRSGS